MVQEIEANLCFAIFGKNSNIQNGRHFWGVENFLKIAEYISQTPCGSKILTKSLYLAWLRFCHFSKIQNGRHFWGGENSLQIAKSILLRYPVGRKFRRNHSFLARLRR